MRTQGWAAAVTISGLAASAFIWLGMREFAFAGFAIAALGILGGIAAYRSEQTVARVAAQRHEVLHGQRHNEDMHAHGMTHRGIRQLPDRLAETVSATKSERTYLNVGDVVRVEEQCGNAYTLWHWRLPIHIAGAPADDLDVVLESIVPPPVNWPLHAQFPYSTRPHPTGQRLVGGTRNATEWFELCNFSSYVDSPRGANPAPPVHVDGFDTHDHLGTLTHFKIVPMETWRLRYRITCRNAEPQWVCFRAQCDSYDIHLRRED